MKILFLQEQLKKATGYIKIKSLFRYTPNKYEERNSFPYGETIAHDERCTFPLCGNVQQPD